MFLWAKESCNDLTKKMHNISLIVILSFIFLIFFIYLFLLKNRLCKHVSTKTPMGCMSQIAINLKLKIENCRLLYDFTFTCKPA